MDGKTVTLSGAIGYVIEDIGKLYTTLHHAEDTIANMAMVAIAQYVSTHEIDVCHPDQIVAYLRETLDFGKFGLGEVTAYLTDFSVVRTYRLIGDVQYGRPYNGPSALSTERADPLGNPS
jgi:hypothetical protein